MSAFLNSGRSDHQELSEITVSFRPRADTVLSSQEIAPHQNFPQNSLQKIATQLIGHNLDNAD